MIDVERILADTLTICGIAAPTGREQARAAYLADQLRPLPGVDEARIDAAGSVTARIGGARADAPAVIVAAHLDTVFGDEVELHPARDGDRLRGPGIGDNALGVATLLALARELSALRPLRGVVLAGTVGEEGLGNLRGARALVEAIPARAFVALEGHGVDHLCTQGVGSARLAVTYTGPGGHSWGDRGAPSAIHALARAAARVAEEIRATFPTVSVNVGTFHGGTGVNVIAARAELRLDLRAVDPESLARAEAAARGIFAAVAEQQGVAPAIDVLGRRGAGGIPEDHPLVLAAQRARVAAGLPEAALRQGSTDANAAYERGIPAITLGITRGGGTHSPDEYIEIAPIGAGAQAALNLLVDLAGDAAEHEQPVKRVLGG